MGFVIEIVAETDIPFLLQGIMQGPLLESNCSSIRLVIWLRGY